MKKSKPQKPKNEILFVENVEMIPIDKLISWEQNPRHNDTAVDPIAKSIQQYGMLVPLLINEKNAVIAGNTRLKACKLLGVPKVPCVRAEHLTPLQQKMYNVADNKLGEIATWNQDMLKDILSDIQGSFEANFDPGLVGFHASEMELIFEGWNSNAARIGDIKSDDSSAPGKIVVTCPAEEEDSFKMFIEKSLNENGFSEFKIK